MAGLPFSIIEDEKAKLIVQCVENELYTPSAIRTLSPRDSNFRGRYIGDGFQRDSSYHQGTAWPWLMGTFIESWIKANGGTKSIKKEAHRKFFLPFIENLNNSGNFFLTLK